MRLMGVEKYMNGNKKSIFQMSLFFLKCFKNYLIFFLFFGNIFFGFVSIIFEELSNFFFRFYLGCNLKFCLIACQKVLSYQT